MTQILIIKTGDAIPTLRDTHGDFEDWFAAGLGVACQVVDVTRGQALPENGFDAVVVTGSPVMVTERRGWSERTAAWLANLIERSALPMLGVCYGHQLIAHALGGVVADNPQGRQIGTIEVSFEDHDDDPLLGELPSTCRAHASHVQVVVEPPDGAQVLASAPRDLHHVIRFRSQVWGLQFHPEWQPEITRGYLHARRSAISAEGHDVDQLSSEVSEAEQAAAVLARFADLVDE